MKTSNKYTGLMRSINNNPKKAPTSNIGLHNENWESLSAQVGSATSIHESFGC